MANERLTKIYVKLIVIAALIAFSILMVWQKRPPLGLDLKGGTELIYRVRTEDLSKSEQVNVVERTIAVVRKRVDPDGSLGLSIREHGRDRFYIQLPTMDPREGRRIEDIIRRAVVDEVDHRHLSIEVPWLAGLNTTAENLAKVFFERIAPELPGAVRLASVTVHETERNSATFRS